MSDLFDESAVDAGVVLREVNEVHGTDYVMVGALVGGYQSGAWRIAGDDGKHAVLKWSRDLWWAGQVQRAARAVELVRARQYPTPAWVATGTTKAGYGYQVQEFVVGAPANHLTVEVAREAVRVLEQHDDLGPDPERSWSDFVVETHQKRSAATRAAVTAIGPSGAVLVDECVRLLDRFDLPALPRADLVHGDFRLGNVLLDNGRVSGVVDIEALGSGTRVLDYATLLDHHPADDEAVSLLIDVARQVAGPAVLAHCFVHVALDLALFMQRLPTLSPTSLNEKLDALADRVRQMPES